MQLDTPDDLKQADSSPDYADANAEADETQPVEIDDAQPTQLLTDGGVSAADLLEVVDEVWVVAGNNGGTTHADRDCRRLCQSPRTPRRVEAVPGLPLRADVCRTCAPDDVLEDEELVADGAGSYCAACHRSVAREDRVTYDGDVYHRQCAPDDVLEHRTLDELRSDGGREQCPYCEHPLDTEADNDALAADPDNDFFCPMCGALFADAAAVAEEAEERDDSGSLLTDGGRPYRCHSRTNDVATLLLTDPLYNRRLRAVIDGA